MKNDEKKRILSVSNLSVSFKVKNGEVNALRDLSFELYEGETLAIVGESGSGKTICAKAIMGLLDSNGDCVSGKIDYTLNKPDGSHEQVDLASLEEREFQSIRGREIAMVFQNPMTSLNPVMSIGEQIEECLKKHRGLNKLESKKRAIDLIDMVGISEPKLRYSQYPHEFSGGMRQRIVIAIALACNPRILICDEPTTALDVSVQAQILELIDELRVKNKISVIFITHNLGVVANIADRVMVMYAGKLVEIGTANEVFYKPQHPYTWALLAAMPSIDMGVNSLYSLPGSPPDMANPPKGDAFALRSEYAMRIDFEEAPPLFKLSDTHFAATWLLHPDAPKVEPPPAIKKLMKGRLGDA